MSQPQSARGRVDVSDLLAPSHHGTSANSDVVDTWAGKVTRLKALHPWAKAFLVVAMLEILIVVALTIQRMAIISYPFTDDSRADMTYAVVLLINAVFSCYYAVHGCLRERKTEVAAFVVASLTVTIYVVYQYAFNPPNTDPDYESNWHISREIRFILICIFEPMALALAFLTQRHFGWVEYKTVGANVDYMRLHRDYSMYVTFLKFDMQIQLSLVVLSLFSRLELDAEMGIDMAAVVVVLITMIVGWLAVQSENRSAMIFVAISSVITLAYDVYTIYKFSSSSNDASSFARYAILAAASFAILIRLVLFFFIRRVVSNFGQGLKSMLHKRSHHQRPASEEDPLIRPSYY
ncbi:hypothetical protein CAOG_06661 [Capsaspora owczarzaki ATCC 30864]|uniref:DUF7789 domain-containing protein n=1 Tax=Capsaspora owczarzaki (strain ATCC 30864) TaxID=595528 RepID=A0A0D2X4M5_CAPO3|nr:hypothetical protein CAOG_06661 [Capsaspora owczarzaki ATCC 30864]KJE96319.1 hypothetical protein CAOG_006661 [Capsaspora owczarzaki ATCC 30864]|eukprot:XP_004344282.2 hypothetical protein CAOG_06661 [Capsaspora owczarzaki ATCC 30864]